MVAFEIVQNGEFVDKQTDTEIGLEVKFKPANNEFLQECNAIVPKVQAFLRKLEQLRLKEENQGYSLNLPSIGTEGSIGVCERDSAVTSIKSMQRFYNYNCDTLADAVYFLDRFISKVKVKRRYLSCVATAAFFLSTKMNEESEYHPSASDLASLHRHSWKPSDLKRMEKIMLEKLGWDLYPAATCLSFIHTIYRMLALVCSEIDRDFLELVVRRSELCMNYSRCASYRASTLALSIILQCLKETDCSSMLTKYLLLQVQTVFRVSDSELFDCQCAISEQFELFNFHPSTHPRCLPMPKIVPRPNLIKRPSVYGSTDLPVIEEVPRNLECSDMSSTVDHIHQNKYTDTGNLTKVETVMTPSYCQLLDQCYLKHQGALFHYKKCNISVL